jgi:hypothetical protein
MLSSFIFEVPGQGLTLHDHGVPMGPDWELVTDSAMYHLTSYAKEHGGLDLDWDRIAVAGPSLGGYFALRSVASAFNTYLCCGRSAVRPVRIRDEACFDALLPSLGQMLYIRLSC